MDRRERPSPRRQRAFTLLELLTVLAIIAMTLAVVLPALTSSSAVELKASARDVAAALRTARSQAIFSQRSKVVTFELESRTFRVPGRHPERAIADGIRVQLYTAANELVGEQSGAIRFFPDGSSTGGRVTLSSKRMSLAVDVDWFTGRIRILDHSTSRSGA